MPKYDNNNTGRMKIKSKNGNAHPSSVPRVIDHANMEPPTVGASVRPTMHIATVKYMCIFKHSKFWQRELIPDPKAAAPEAVRKCPCFLK